MLCALLSKAAWAFVLYPVVVLIMWWCWLIIMADIALLLVFYSIMLWWRTWWQNSIIVAFFLLVVVLLYAYEICVVYVTIGSNASKWYSPSGFFFGASTIALAINMLIIWHMVFNGNGLDVDEYVWKAHQFAYCDSIEMGLVSCLPKPKEPNELYPWEFTRALHLGLFYLGSLIVLLVHSISYGLTVKVTHWLGASY